MCILHLYPSIGRHPCCLHILVIVNNAAMNIQVLISVQISIFVFLGEITRSLYAGLFHSFILYFFEESQCCFPQWLYQFKFLPTVHELSFFSTFSQMLDNGHFGVSFAFPWWLVMLSVFYVCWISVYLLWKNICGDPLPTFCSLVLNFVSSLYILSI